MKKLFKLLIGLYFIIFTNIGQADQISQFAGRLKDKIQEINAVRLSNNKIIDKYKADVDSAWPIFYAMEFHEAYRNNGVLIVSTEESLISVLKELGKDPTNKSKDNGTQLINSKLIELKKKLSEKKSQSKNLKAKADKASAIYNAAFAKNDDSEANRNERQMNKQASADYEINQIDIETLTKLISILKTTLEPLKTYGDNQSENDTCVSSIIPTQAVDNLYSMVSPILQEI